MVLKKFIIITILILNFLSFPVSAIAFSYSAVTVREIDWNYFEANITSGSSYTTQQVFDAINASGEKSANIQITSIKKIPSGYLIYGSLINYSIPKNKLFNPWYNTSYEKRKIFNMTGVEGGKVWNMTGELYNKSDRWINHSNNQPIITNNYTLIKGQVFVHLLMPASGDYQIAKYVNSSDSFPGVTNETLTYQFWDNISKTTQFNTTKWKINIPAFETVTVVNDYLNLSCTVSGCSSYIGNAIYGQPSLDKFSNFIFVFEPTGANLGIGGSVRDPNATTTQRSEFVRNDDILGTADDSSYSTEVMTIPNAKQKIELYKTPWYVVGIQNDSIIVNKTNNIHNGGDAPFFSSYDDLIKGNIRLYSVVGYNRSNGTATIYGEETLQIMTITSWGNTYTNDASLSFNALQNSAITFNVTTSLVCDNCSWNVGGIGQGINSTSLNYMFSSLGTTLVNVTAYNSTYSSTDYKNWSVTVTQAYYPNVTNQKRINTSQIAPDYGFNDSYILSANRYNVVLSSHNTSIAQFLSAFLALNQTDAQHASAFNAVNITNNQHQSAFNSINTSIAQILSAIFDINQTTARQLVTINTHNTSISQLFSAVFGINITVLNQGIYNNATFVNKSDLNRTVNFTVGNAANLTNSLPIAVFNNGAGASSSTYWRGDLTWATPAGSSSPPWQGKLHTTFGDGDPSNDEVFWSFINTADSVAAPTPTGIGTTTGRLQMFRYQTAITVKHIYFFGLATVTGIYTLSIYNGDTNTKVWDGWGNTTANWTTITPTPFTLNANTTYWVGISAVTTGTTAGFRTPVSPIASSTGTMFLPGTMNTYFAGRYAEVALTGGAWPATLPSLRAAAFASAGATGTVPILFLDSS